MRARKNLRTSVERKEMVTLEVSKETEKKGGSRGMGLGD